MRVETLVNDRQTVVKNVYHPGNEFFCRTIYILNEDGSVRNYFRIYKDGKVEEHREEN